MTASLIVSATGAYRTRVYLEENAHWLTAHGTELARAPDTAQAQDAEHGVRDDFRVERGPVALCHWEDPYARWVPALSRARAAARARHWRAGTRVRLKLDPAAPASCRPAYGWAEFVRLELTGYLFGVMLAAGTALFLGLARRD